MNSTPEAAEPSESPEPASKPKKQISAKRRIISWAFIGVLLVVVLIEWRAQSSHGSTVKKLDAALEQSRPQGEVPFAEFKEIKKGNPDENIDDSGVLNRKYHYRWNGLFKVYHLRLLVDKEDNIIIYDTLAEGDKVGGIKIITKKSREELVKKHKEAAQGKPAKTESGEKKPAEEKPTKKEEKPATKESTKEN